MNVESNVAAFWLVQKTCVTLATNHMQNWTNHDLVAHVFPRCRQFGRFYFEFSLALKYFPLFWLAFVITLVFVFWHLIEKCSMYVCVYLFYSLTMLWEFFASVSFNIELFRCEITKQPKTTLVFINLELQNWLKILDKCWLDCWIFLYSGLVIEH